MIFGKHDAGTLAQFRDVASRAERAALMADGHVGYVMPIGGVAAYDNRVSVVGVGFDIACGNAAIRTNLRSDDILGSAESLADEIRSSISFGMGRTNRADDAPVDHPLFTDDAWTVIPERHREQLRVKARAQLGTVGSGNHYVDVLVDEAGAVWVGVHFGSRGLGHTIASAFLALSQCLTWGERAREVEVLLDLDAPIGHDYWALMNLAGRYAYAGREWVARKVVEMFGGVELELVHNHHNFAWREQQADRTGADASLIVIRKGATPAFPGQSGFVGGSMGDDAVIVRGASSTNEATQAQQQAALYSTVHGAGRVMSRTEAAGRVQRRTGKVKRPGRVTWEMLHEWTDRRGVVLRGGGLDESPHVYRRLPDVLDAQGDTIEIVHTLRPLIVVMAGADEYDPYRD